MSMDSVHRFIVAYDVRDDLRRTRVAKLLESYGDRAQYSLFLVDLKPARLVKLKTRLRGLLDSDDSVFVCDLGPLSHGGTHRIEFIGPRRPITGAGPLVY